MMEPNRTPARARPATVEERVQAICDLMARGEWTATTHVELAEVWGVSPSTVRNYSAEASRLVRSIVSVDPDEVRAQCMIRLDAAYTVAKGDADASGMVRATMALAKIVGVDQPSERRPGDDAKVVEVAPTVEAFLREYIPTASRHQIAVARAAEGVPSGLSPEEEIAFFGRRLVPGVRPRNVEVVAGRGSAKTAIAAIAGVVSALTVDLSKAKPGDPVSVPLIAPNKQLAKKTLAAVHAVADLPSVARHVVDRGNWHVVLRRDDGKEVSISVHAATQKGVNVRGEWLAALVIDEAAFLGDELNDVNAGDVVKSAKPRLLGPLWAISSPNGEDDYVKPRYDEHRVSGTDCPTCGGRCTWVVAHADSATMNPAYNAEAEAEMRRTDPDAADREFGAKFIDASTQWIPTEWVKRALVFAADVPPDSQSYYVAAMDPATRGNGWTLVIGRVDEQRRLEVAVAREKRGSKREPLDARQVFDEWAPLLKQYGCERRVYSDQASFDVLSVVADSAGVALIQHEVSPTDIGLTYRLLYQSLSEQTIRLPDVPNMSGDICAVRRRHTMQGGQVVSKIELPAKSKDGRHFDYAPAVATLVWQLRYAGGPTPAQTAEDDEEARFADAAGTGSGWGFLDEP